MRYLSEQNWEEAVLAFGEAIRIDPNRPEAYLGRGDAYRGRGGEGDLEAALADYAMARQLAGEMIRPGISLVFSMRICTRAQIRPPIQNALI